MHFAQTCTYVFVPGCVLITAVKFCRRTKSFKSLISLIGYVLKMCEYRIIICTSSMFSSAVAYTKVTKFCVGVEDRSVVGPKDVAMVHASRL
jgi:hypothetical protein